VTNRKPAGRTRFWKRIALHRRRIVQLSLSAHLFAKRGELGASHPGGPNLFVFPSVDGAKTDIDRPGQRFLAQTQSSANFPDLRGEGRNFDGAPLSIFDIR